MKNLVIQILDLYMIVILIRVLFSWIRVKVTNPFVGIVYTLTEPVLAPIRNILPNMGGIDISPLVVFFAYNLIIKPIFFGL